MDGKTRRTRKNTAVLVILAVAVVLAAFACVLVGSSHMTVAECFDALLGRVDGAAARIIWNIRIPRLLAALIALSRLYLYVHFPTDVLGGAALGILSGWLGVRLTDLAAGRKDHLR